LLVVKKFPSKLVGWTIPTASKLGQDEQNDGQNGQGCNTAWPTPKIRLANIQILEVD